MDAQQFRVLMPGAFECTLPTKCQVSSGLLDAAAVSRPLLPRLFETQWPAAKRHSVRSLGHTATSFAYAYKLRYTLRKRCSSIRRHASDPDRGWEDQDQESTAAVL